MWSKIFISYCDKTVRILPLIISPKRLASDGFLKKKVGRSLFNKRPEFLPPPPILIAP